MTLPLAAAASAFAGGRPAARGPAHPVSLLTLPVFVLLLVFAIRYREGSPANRQHRAERNVKLEVVLGADPVRAEPGVLRLGGQALLRRAQCRPPGALEIYVRRQAVDVEVRSTRTASARSTSCTCRSAQPVRLVMTSQDVIHSFFVPAFRHQAGRPAGALHRRSGSTPTSPACSVCSAPSSAAPTIRAMGGQRRDHDARATTRAGSQRQRRPTDARARRASAVPQLGCSGCHGATASGARAAARTASTAARCRSPTASVVIADEHYIRDCILLPQKDVAAGYEPIMPTFAGQLDEDDLLELDRLHQVARPPTPGGAAMSTARMPR